MALDDDTVRLAKGENLATVVTLMPDGQPQALLTWVDTDGDAARAHIDFLSRKYTGHDYSAPVGPHGRVILTIAADKINTPKPLGR